VIRHSRSIHRPAPLPLRALLTVAALAALPVASGCAAGRDAQTSREYQATETVNASRNGVDIRNLFILGPTPGQTLPAGSAAPVYLSLINNTNTQDRLVAVTAPGLATSAQLPGGGVDMPPRQLVAPGKPGSANASPITLQGLTAQVRGGEWRALTLEFQRAGLVRVNVPVVPWQDSYLTYSPAPPPSPSAAPGGTPGGTARPGASPTPGPGGSRSPGASPTPTDTGG
jgi:hypothetical protein